MLRSALYEVFAAFDFASPSTSNGNRGSTLVAPQALFMMNAPLMDEASRGFAKRLSRESGGGEADRIGLAFQVAYSRPPDAGELAEWRKFLERYAIASGSRSEAWQALCRVLLASNEFLFLQ